LLAEPPASKSHAPTSQWLTDPEQAHAEECFGLADVGVLYALLDTFANDSTELFPGSRLEGDGDDRTLAIPALTGADVRTFGRIAGSSLNTGASGQVRPWASINMLALNEWVTVERSASELRIRLGDRARKLYGPLEN
jgi:hypothetical protein